MPSPPIQIFLTTIASQPALRQRQEYLLRILQAKRIPYTSYDLASDEKAKSLFRRKVPSDKQQIPGILVGGTFPGSFSEFEEAVEYGELDAFLRLKETWHDAEDDRPLLPQQTIAVPGAHTPLQMTPEHLRPKILASNASAAASPSRGSKLVPVNKRMNDLDLGDELSGYGLQGVKVSNEELLSLVAELGLDGDEAGDLVKGLGGDAERAETPPVQEVKAVDDAPVAPTDVVQDPSNTAESKQTSDTVLEEDMRKSQAVVPETQTPKTEELEPKDKIDAMHERKSLSPT